MKSPIMEIKVQYCPLFDHFSSLFLLGPVEKKQLILNFDLKHSSQQQLQAIIWVLTKYFISIFKFI